MRALVLEGIVRECLAVVRSLGRQGVKIDVGDPHRINPARFSKYVSKFFHYPDPKDSPENFYEWLLNHVKKEKYDMVFPLNDYTYEVCTRYQEELGQYTRLAVNSLEKFDFARDKGKTLKFAQKMGIPMPQTWFPRSLKELKDISKELPDFPILLKPARSSGSRGVRIVKDEDDLFNYFSFLMDEFGEILVQEYIPGTEIIDVPMIFNMNGQVRGALVNNRVRMFPANGGPNVAGHAIINEDIKKEAIHFLEKIGWQGVGLVEFKIDGRNGQPKLMEINPRFWGSTQLGISAGIDWPWMLYQAVVHGDCETVMDYRTDKLVRWLIPGELMYFLTCKDKKRLWPDFYKFFDKNTDYYVFDKKDLLPTFGLLMTVAINLFNPKMLKMFVFRN
jgi:predicted ATP-grasp superfamily ATP-dependent carboligase